MQTHQRLITTCRSPRLLHVALLGLAPGIEPSTRHRVFELVQKHPGLHQRDIARRAGLRSGHAEYHLHQLVRLGLLREETSGRYKRYFVALKPMEKPTEGTVEPKDRQWLALLREARPLEIVAHLIQDDSLEIGQVAQRTGLAASTTSYHIDKLEKQQIVERYRVGKKRYVRLTDRERLVKVLLAHEPPDDLIEGFEDLWDDLGL